MRGAARQGAGISGVRDTDHQERQHRGLKDSQGSFHPATPTLCYGSNQNFKKLNARLEKPQASQAHQRTLPSAAGKVVWLEASNLMQKDGE